MHFKNGSHLIFSSASKGSKLNGNGNSVYINNVNFRSQTNIGCNSVMSYSNNHSVSTWTVTFCYKMFEIRESKNGKSECELFILLGNF